MSAKVGMVLSGGGGKGAYIIGVWKALREFGVDKNIASIAGTSIGSLNAALILNEDYNLAERIWLEISPDKVFTLNVQTILKMAASFVISSSIPIKLLPWATGVSMGGVFSRDGLLDMINRIDLCKVSNSHIHCYATCCETPLLKASPTFDLKL